MNENKPNEIVISEKTAKASPKSFPQLTVGQLKYSYAHLPNKFFETQMSPMQFGFWTLEFFKTVGLSAGPDVPATPVLGYAFCTALSPVQIAVYCYYCFNGSASIKEVSKKRKLTPRIVNNSRNELIELGLLVEKDGVFSGASLDDLVGPPLESPIGHYAPEEVSAIAEVQPEPVAGSPGASPSVPPAKED